MCAISGMRQWKVHALFISPIPLMRQLRNWLFWLVQILMAEPLTNWVSEWLYKPKPSLHPHRPAQDIKRAAGKQTHFCCIKTLKLWIFLLLEHNLIHSLMLFNHSLVSNSLTPHGLQRARLLCPSVLLCLPEFAQTHIHWVGDAIQPSQTLSSPTHPAFNLSQYQGLP